MPTEPTGSSRAPFTTRFSLAANSDAELVPALKGYPVDAMYGKLPGDGISGGRQLPGHAPLYATQMEAKKGHHGF